MIIDCHVHLNNYTEEPVTLEERYARLLSQMEKHRIDHAFAISSYIANEKRPSIDRLVELTRNEPRVHLIEGMSLYGKAPYDLHATEERLRRREVVALKLYPGYEHYYPHDRICDPVYELATEYDVPVMIHTGDTYNTKAKVKYAHPLHVDDVAVDHPDLRIIMAHLGNPWFRDTAEIIYKNPNVWTDISGLVLGDVQDRFEGWLQQQVTEIIAFAGEPDKILFGTDWPIVNMGPYLRLMEGIDLEPEDRARIMWKNAARVFKLPGAELEPPRPHRVPTVQDRPDSGAHR